jgi:hypothetical protein
VYEEEKYVTVWYLDERFPSYEDDRLLLRLRRLFVSPSMDSTSKAILILTHIDSCPSAQILMPAIWYSYHYHHQQQYHSHWQVYQQYTENWWILIGLCKRLESIQMNWFDSTFMIESCGY